MTFDESLLKKIEALSISSLNDIKTAKELKDEATKYAKMVEEMRVEAVRPYLEAQRKINDKARVYTNKLEETKSLIVKKISDYETARRAEEARIAKLQSDLIMSITNAPTKEDAQAIYNASDYKNATIDLVLAQRLESPEAFEQAVIKLENEVVIDKKVK